MNFSATTLVSDEVNGVVKARVYPIPPDTIAGYVGPGTIQCSIPTLLYLDTTSANATVQLRGAVSPVIRAKPQIFAALDRGGRSNHCEWNSEPDIHAAAESFHPLQATERHWKQPYRVALRRGLCSDCLRSIF